MVSASFRCSVAGTLPVFAALNTVSVSSILLLLVSSVDDPSVPRSYPTHVIPVHPDCRSSDRLQPSRQRLSPEADLVRSPCGS